jgi:UDP-glucose 4-epimerase
VDDVTGALVALSRAENPPIVVNVGSGVGVSVREVSEAVATALGVTLSLLRFGKIPRRAVDQDCLVAKIERLRTIIEPPVQRWKVAELAGQCVAEFMASDAADDSGRKIAV